MPLFIQVSIMKLFFDREEKHLDFTTQRLTTRNIEKKDFDSTKLVPTKVRCTHRVQYVFV